MALFPDIVGESRRPIPYFHATRTPTGENHLVRYRKFVRPRVAWDLAWSLLTPAQALLIDNHVLSHAAAHLSFDWFDWRTFHWLWVPFGTGNGATATFDLPGKTLSDIELRKNASTSITGTVTEGAGADGRAQVVLDVVPASGDALWLNATMKRLFTATFENDRQPLTSVQDSGRYAFATRIRQVK